MSAIVHKSSVIFHADHLGTKRVFKFPKFKDEMYLIDFELAIYKQTNHRAFSLFNDEISIDSSGKFFVLKETPDLIIPIKNNFKYPSNMHGLSGPRNENLVTLDIYIKTLPIYKVANIFRRVFLVLDEVFCQFNFTHGDFKQDNILIDKVTDEIYFIDFEFSIIHSTDKTFVDGNVTPIDRYLYLPRGSYVTKDFAHLFDVFLFTVSLKNSINDLYQLLNACEELIMNYGFDSAPSFTRFYVLYKTMFLEEIVLKDKEGHCYVPFNHLYYILGMQFITCSPELKRKHDEMMEIMTQMKVLNDKTLQKN